MKESIERICYGFRAKLIASLKMILFLGTLLYLLLTILLLSHTTHIGNSLMINPYITSRLSVIFYINNGANCLIALVGLYGLLNNNMVALKAFPNMLFATSLMLSMYLIFGATYTSNISDARNEYLDLLNIYMSSYNWNGSSSPDHENHNQSVRATGAWDSAQSESCCGVGSYEDWNKHRPAEVPSHSYPKSCCPVAHLISDNTPGLFCSEDSDLYRQGCAKLGATFWSLTLTYHFLFLIYQIIMDALAWFHWRQIRPGNGIILGRGINSTKNRQCTPEIPTEWSSS